MARLTWPLAMGMSFNWQVRRIILNPHLTGNWQGNGQDLSDRGNYVSMRRRPPGVNNVNWKKAPQNPRI
jgi:hypothetical protein